MGIKGLMAAAIAVAVLIGVALPGASSRPANGHTESQLQTLALK